MKKISKEEREFAVCIACEEVVMNIGMTSNNDGTGDGFNISECVNRKCIRYGLLTSITE